jgi:CTP:molybdopterin cytidylyltransferase MocA
VRIVVAEDWEVGISASLRAGLRELGARPHGGAGAGPHDPGAGRDGGAGADAALLTLVDLPGLPVSVAERLLGGGFGPAGLRQAVFGGRPGHPVLIGRDHWAALAETTQGDRGARPYLVAHDVVEVECGDLAGGEDVDSR